MRAEGRLVRRALMQVMCLRRSKDILSGSLPARTIEIHKVTLDPRPYTLDPTPKTLNPRP